MILRHAQIVFRFYLLISLVFALTDNSSADARPEHEIPPDQCDASTSHANRACGHLPGFKSGPLRRQETLTLEDILELSEPMLVYSQNFLDAFRKEGFGSLSAFQQRFGEEILHFIGDEENLRNPTMVPNLTVNTYIQDHMMDINAETPWRLSESGGRAFFLAHPALFENIASAFAELVPKNFRDSLDIGPEDHEDLLEDWAQDPSNGVLALWTGYAGYRNWLHVDIVPVTLLSQFVGRKRVFLFPPEQFQFLYMRQTGWETYNWENVSLLDLVWDDRTQKLRILGEGSEEKHPLFQHASPLVVDLNPGDTLFIPCGWAHFILYTTAGMSVSAITFPNATRDRENFMPLQCTDFFK